MLAHRRILLIEDNDQLATLYQEQLAANAAIVKCCGNGTDGMAAVKAFRPSAILLDIQLPDIDGFSVLKSLQLANNKVPVVVMTAHSTVNHAVEAMKLGAYDFLAKPFDGQRLIVTLRNAIDHYDLTEIVKTVAFSDGAGFHEFVGSAPAMQSVYRTISAAAGSKASVFITGESGTGKELCARAVHQESPRRSGPFIALNCGAIPRDLMESEIFGHRKGAFTGAISNRIGAAELADGGTLFLDEIGEMDMDLQTKLLRFVQTGTFSRIGDYQEQKVDVRFVCATNREPEEAIRGGILREDLFYRLNVIPIRMPPLRERPGDIEAIARHLLTRFVEEEGKQFRGFDSLALTKLRRYSWPGNVRELENVIRNAVVLNDGDMVTEEMVVAAIGERSLATNRNGRETSRPSPKGEERKADQIRLLADVERDAIERAIALCNENVPQAAAALGVAPSTLYRKLQSWKDV
ncbi:sigma-54-dependent Fis family transcriptional regulator [Rhodospirillaceae bacterium KN72]|uniref:Sigma-54-dependent Fis family transcriptional regulator n=1 Tax=Pacificispira spongiicola TaxID=2729598 RepID=A0A7Y0E3Q9_9PROT|nr:sigma-54 dependent transcriptional regulator [Pacificispira spongiicola]NMM46707.1 sigma-54-dependent Fis family transcriptional regulator [Pacificispira spongiicola]